MSKKRDLIDRGRLLRDPYFQEDRYPESHLLRMAIREQPVVDAVEVPDKELLKAIKLLIKQYERSKNSDYVHSPVAHALYHTWRRVDERGTDNEKT